MKNKSLFEAGYSDNDSPTWCSLEWIRHFEVTDSKYAEGFKDGANKIIDHLQKQRHHRHPDYLFFPIAYLYRHSLELQLKYILVLGRELNLIENSLFKNISSTHNLQHLWKLSKNILISFWPKGNPKDLNLVEKIIVEIHNLDENSQNFRYSRDKQEKETAYKMPAHIELIDFKKFVEHVYDFLDGCRMGLENEIEDRREYQYECNS